MPLRRVCNVLPVRDTEATVLDLRVLHVTGDEVEAPAAKLKLRVNVPLRGSPANWADNNIIQEFTAVPAEVDVRRHVVKSGLALARRPRSPLEADLADNKRVFAVEQFFHLSRHRERRLLH